jgi:decaprenylphospho-beta-D-ribofuranose 2-oxidase
VILPRDRVERRAGFGENAAADAYVYRPSRVEEIAEIFELARRSGRQVAFRGAGRSYGDAAILSEGILIDLTRMNRVLDWDPGSGLLRVEGGATIETLWRTGLEDGYWPPVVSGTMAPTVGGAVAMNIHGKNNFRAGVFADHLEEFRVLAPSGQAQTVRPSDAASAVFPGSLGCLGVLTEATIRMKRVPSGDLKVLPVAFGELEGAFQAFETFEADADYMVAWIDAFASGRQTGRGLFHAAWYQKYAGNSQATFRFDHQELPDTILGFLPKSITWRMLRMFNRPSGVRAINAAKYWASRILGSGRPHPQSLVEFSFLLDYVPGWQRAYPNGFVQIQAFVPKESAREAFRRILEESHRLRRVANLAVMKRHRPDRYLLSHGVDGYSLALDYACQPGRERNLRQLHERIAQIVLETGGRFYPAKDSLLDAVTYQRSLGPETVARFQAERDVWDPDGLLKTELARRLWPRTGD